ncbi:MAG: TrkH family potassium uptake protein [Bacteroidetes bacterium]|nr:TrkH family potassium uptake protein [Bacteroidota bacterium]
MQGRFQDFNLGIVARIIGILLLIEAVFMTMVLSISFVDNTLHNGYFARSVGITLLAGIILYALGTKAPTKVGKRDAYIIVSLTWIVTSFFGALPFYLSGYIPSITDAYFETVSGFTTTGASILTDIEVLPRDLLFWRALTHWLGGMGIIVLSVAVLPFLGIGGMQLFMAEMPGVTYDKLHPRITATAKRLWGIYVLLTIAQFLLLWAGEMDWFDSACHAFATMATGGFSTRNASMAAFGPYSQYVTIIFMVLAGTNFTLHYFALHGWFRKVWENEEFRIYLNIIVFSTLIIALNLYFHVSSELEPLLRNILFTVVSILTTTGFVTVDYLQWPVFLWMIIFVLMFIGGSAGSTGGGIKVIRQSLLLKNSFLEMRRAIHPAAVLPAKYNGKSVSQDVVYKVMGFFVVYILIFAAGVMVLSAMGIDFDTSIGASAACLGNIGPGIGKVGPVFNYFFLPDAAKWVLSLLMVLGRLELFTVLMLFSRHFWRK